MEYLTLNNPFFVGKYLSERYFYEQSTKTEFLRKQIVNRRDFTLRSLRPVGKSNYKFNRIKLLILK